MGRSSSLFFRSLSKCSIIFLVIPLSRYIALHGCIAFKLLTFFFRRRERKGGASTKRRGGRCGAANQASVTRISIPIYVRVYYKYSSANRPHLQQRRFFFLSLLPKNCDVSLALLCILSHQPARRLDATAAQCIVHMDVTRG